MTDWRLGTMGFGYADWSGVFYPQGLKSSEYLSYYARHFNSVELDTTFYATPDVARVKHWAASVPEDFRFAMKTPRTITHEGVLDQNMGLMSEFIDAIRHFDEKLGVVLLQFPPMFEVTHGPKLRTFLRSLPEDVRFAVEFRHASWFVDSVETMLRDHNVAWAAAEYAAAPRGIRITADFLYVRWIGEHNRFDKLNFERIDVTDRLLWWQKELQEKSGHVNSVWGYMNNDYTGYAIPACNRMKELLGLPTDPRDVLKQPSLFE
jgi:uncharacterized protein YecE (DUF72 family)